MLEDFDLADAPPVRWRALLIRALSAACGAVAAVLNAVLVRKDEDLDIFP